MKIYKPLSPPPVLHDYSNVIDGHIYKHFYDYEPNLLDDHLFLEYGDFNLFPWLYDLQQKEKQEAAAAAAAANQNQQNENNLSNSSSSIALNKRKKSSSSNDISSSDKKSRRKENSSPAANRNRKSNSRQNISTENLFSYKQGNSRKTTTNPRSRKRTIDESLLVRIPFSQQEDEIIKAAHSIFSQNWILISDILNTSMEHFSFRTPGQCAHHYHTNLSPYKSAPKKARTKSSQPSTPSSPQSEVEYQPPSFCIETSFNSIINLYETNIKNSNSQLEASTLSTLKHTEPHVSHIAVRNSLGISFGVTPAEVIRLQAQKPSNPQQSAPPQQQQQQQHSTSQLYPITSTKNNNTNSNSNNLTFHTTTSVMQPITMSNSTNRLVKNFGKLI